MEQCGNLRIKKKKYMYKLVLILGRKNMKLMIIVDVLKMTKIKIKNK